LTIVEERAITGGVDTHADVHVAAALDPIGGLLGVQEFPATAAGYARLLGWLGGFEAIALVGIEGTGSRPPVPVTVPRKELIHRLRRRRCELCDHGATVAVHQVAGLASLGRPGQGQPAWAALMAKNTAQDPHRLRAVP